MKILLLSLAGTLLLTGCVSQTQSHQHALTVQTGLPVVDAASHLASGLYLANKAPARPLEPHDPQVKALNDAIERAKSRQLMQQAGQPAVPQQDDDRQ